MASLIRRKYKAKDKNGETVVKQSPYGTSTTRLRTARERGSRAIRTRPPRLS